MAKYRYPAIFHKDKECCGYWVEFPDWCKAHIGAVTDGKNYAQAKYMAEDLLGLLCWDQELEHKECPPASEHQTYLPELLSGDFIELIDADTEAYAKVMAHVKKGRWRWRMLERARKRYIYNRPTISAI